MPYKKSINKKHPNFQELYEFEDIRATTRFSIERPTINSGYYPITLCGRDQVYAIGNTYKLGTYELSNTQETIYTLRYYYATQVWNTAIAIASNSVVGNPFLYILPHWVDRDDSFRKLVNDDKFTQDSIVKLWKLMEDIANSGNIKVHEGYTIINETKDFWGGPDNCYMNCETKFHIEIVLDAKNAEIAKLKIKDIWNDIYDKTDKSYGWDEIKGLFKEVSLAQRELLNHHWMHRHNKTDMLLFDACSRLDINDVRRAVERGANVNALDDSGRSALQKAVEWFSSNGISWDKKYTDGERELISKRNMVKSQEIVKYLVDQGADINLYGYEGMTPLVCAYYERSVEMIKFLLELGADPNTNCYLTDGSHFWGYNSTILGCINEDLTEEYDDIEKEIEKIIESAGGRLMAWGWNPEIEELTGRLFICVWPTETDIFYDCGYRACGDSDYIRIERENQEPQIVPLNSIVELKTWHQEFIKYHYEKNGSKNAQFWLDWRKRGLDLAKQVRQLLPDDVDFYYLFDTPTVFEYSYGVWRFNRDGERILILK